MQVLQDSSRVAGTCRTCESHINLLLARRLQWIFCLKTWLWTWCVWRQTLEQDGCILFLSSVGRHWVEFSPSLKINGQSFNFGWSIPIKLFIHINPLLYSFIPSMVASEVVLTAIDCPAYAEYNGWLQRCAGSWGFEWKTPSTLYLPPFEWFLLCLRVQACSLLYSHSFI